MDDIVFSELRANGTVRDTVMEDINWVEEIPVLTKTTLENPTYVLDGNPSVSAVVRLWDQYGNSHRSRAGQTATITIGTGDNNVGTRNVISRGYARWSRKPGAANVAAGRPIAVSYAGITAYARDADGYLVADDAVTPLVRLLVDGDPITNPFEDDGTTVRTDVTPHVVFDDSTPADVNGHQYRAAAGSVQVVNTASSASTGTHTVTHLMVADGKFLALAGETGGDPTLVFSYDDDDDFIDSTGSEGRSVDMDRFQTLLDQDDDHNTVGNGATPSDAAVEVEVVIYNADGTSVFRVTNDGSS